MSVQTTSRESYDLIKPLLGERQQEVLWVFTALDDAFCNSEVALLLDVPISYITPRVKELRELGLLVESHRGTYAPTNRRVIYWKAA